MEGEQVKQQFVSITGTDDDTASQFLNASNGDLSGAVNAFYSSSQDMSAQEITSSSFNSSSNTKYTPTLKRDPLKTDPLESDPFRSKSSKNVSTDNSRIKTFQELIAGTDGDEEDDDDRLYAGGEKSGLAIKGPKKDTDLAKEILKQAALAQPPPDSIAKPSKFTGSGSRLGSDSLQSTSRQPASPPDQELEVVTRRLTFWRNGFSIEDGPLLKYDDPTNQEMLNAIKDGRAPTALLNVKTNQSVEVRVAQRMDEDFVMVAPVISTFSGSGNRLGSIIPAIIPNPDASLDRPNMQLPTFVIDDALPVTAIQIRLCDGTRMVARFNHSHTIGDLRSFVASARSGNSTFVLQTIMPTVVLDDDSKSLSDAGLLNAVVIQRLI